MTTWCQRYGEQISSVTAMAHVAANGLRGHEDAMRSLQLPSLAQSQILVALVVGLIIAWYVKESWGPRQRMAAVGQETAGQRATQRVLRDWQRVAAGWPIVEQTAPTLVCVRATPVGER